MRWLIYLFVAVVAAFGLWGLWQLRPHPPVFESPLKAYTITLPLRWIDNYLVAVNPSKSAFPEAAEVVTFWTLPQSGEQAMPLLTIVAHEEEIFKKLRRKLEIPPAHLQLASNGRYAFMAYFPQANPYAPYTRASERFERLVLPPMELVDGFKPIPMEPLPPKRQPKPKPKVAKKSSKTVIGAPKTVIDEPKTVIDVPAVAPQITTITPPTLAPKNGQ